MMRTGVVICAWCFAACVKWQPVAPPPAPVAATQREPDLPRWVRVTTRDSVRYLLEDAAFRGDTLVGRSGDRAVPVVRVATADIAHVEARLPSVSGSIGVAAEVIAGLCAFFWFIGHAADM